jgi:hypothetical protein
VEFTYNYNYQAIGGMAPCEALYGKRCRTPTYWEEVGDKKLIGLKLVQITIEKVKIRKDRMKKTHDN